MPPVAAIEGTPVHARRVATTRSAEPRIAIALNRRFVPIGQTPSHAVGASGFALAAAGMLAREGMFAGFIDYVRDDDAVSPSVADGHRDEFPSVFVRFNFRMSTGAVQAALKEAALALARRGRRAAASDRRQPPILYHQSNTVLAFQPRHWPFLVTHHGPFASAVCRTFGRSFANEAFQGGDAKVAHLVQSQSRGLRVLDASRGGIALELGRVQEQVLLSEGVPPEKVRRIAPPWDVAGMCAKTETERETEAEAEGLRDVDDSPALSRHALHIVTMVARADRFKNLRLLVDAANVLAGEGVATGLSIFADTTEDGRARASLQDAVAASLRSRTRILPRLSHERLLRYLRRHRDTTVFVCTSLYETFGLTPLEAVLCGMVTLVPDSLETVGVAEYVPPRHRYTPGVDGLVTALRALAGSQRLRALGQAQRDFARRLLEQTAFVPTVRAAVADAVLRSRVVAAVRA